MGYKENIRHSFNLTLMHFDYYLLHSLYYIKGCCNLLKAVAE